LGNINTAYSPIAYLNVWVGNEVQVIATCTSGTAIGGGYTVAGLPQSNGAGIISENKRSGNNGWSVKYTVTTPSTQSLAHAPELTAYVYCVWWSWFMSNQNETTRVLTAETLDSSVDGITSSARSAEFVVPKAKSKVVPALLGLALLGAGLGGGFVIGNSSKKTVVASSTPKLGLASKNMAETFRAQLTGDYETYWSYLYPSQQAKINKEVFLKCVKQPALEEQLEVRSLDEFDQVVNLGVADKNAKVVTVQFRSKSAQGTSTRVVYTLLSDGRWRWLMGENELAAYAAGKCS
jgi:hypothetical protein